MLLRMDNPVHGWCILIVSTMAKACKSSLRLREECGAAQFYHQGHCPLRAEFLDISLAAQRQPQSSVTTLHFESKALPFPKSHGRSSQVSADETYIGPERKQIMSPSI